MIVTGKLVYFCLVSFLTATAAQGYTRRCWTCRSRGEYGDCRDPFAVNLANLDYYSTVDPAPCASGWCGKIVEGNDVEYTVATERLCLPRPPDDEQERCAETHWKHRKVYMCFCMGDLCNGALKSVPSAKFLIAFVGFVIYWIMS